MTRYEVRDPIHGFIAFGDWERKIIDHPVFQRLRRIRQLGFTDMVYPGASHSRFEHSLGVMHLATRMFDQLTNKHADILKDEYGFDKAGLERDRILVRLAALLHDIGHAPFSHAGEGVLARRAGGEAYKHEDYSAAAALYCMGDVIEGHPSNRDHEITAERVAWFLAGDSRIGRSLLWRDLIASQLDADRADYLLRDSYHLGVAYGRYDLDRILHTLTVVPDPEAGGGRLAIEDGGLHAAEALILARYMMFTQVYFHETRRAYDHHVGEVLKTLLAETGEGEGESGSAFPPPTDRASVERYLRWTDWRVLGLMQEGEGGEHAQVIMERRHHRCVHATPEVPSTEDVDDFQEANRLLGDQVTFVDEAKSSWYKFDRDIPILEERGARLLSLSSLSDVVKGLRAVNQMRLYTTPETAPAAKRKIDASIRQQ